MKITSKPKVKHNHSRFDRGKYKWTGTLKDYYGLEVPDYEGIEAVYPERRKDSYGVYVALIAIHA